MSSDYIMTMQQAQMEMELYKKVFTVVRLLDKREFRPVFGGISGWKRTTIQAETWNYAIVMISGRRKSHVRIVLLPGHSRRSQCGQSWNTWIQIFIK